MYRGAVHLFSCITAGTCDINPAVCTQRTSIVRNNMPDFQSSLGNLIPQIVMFVLQGLCSALKLLEETPTIWTFDHRSRIIWSSFHSGHMGQIPKCDPNSFCFSWVLFLNSVNNIFLCGFCHYFVIIVFCTWNTFKTVDQLSSISLDGWNAQKKITLLNVQ